MRFRLSGLFGTGILLWALFGCQERRHTDPIPPPLREDLVHRGMAVDEVRRLLGTPTTVINEHENGLETWIYFEHEANLSPGTQLGGLTVAFENGRVHSIMPISVNRRVE